MYRRVTAVRGAAETGRAGGGEYPCPMARPTSDTPGLEELADGVFAWIQPGGVTGVANAGVIVDDDGLTCLLYTSPSPRDS